MKTKNLFLTVVLLFIATFNYAQTSAEASGIAIQGIARDANNTARINTPITLTFGLYYLNGTTIVPIGSPIDANLTTDNFGVFSYVLEAGVENNAIMANHQAYLKISEGNTTISDEKLNHVPYAIAANNGVPTGSIMPWVGPANAVPSGWVLCNNQSLTDIVGSENLIALVGNNAPDLRGRFLKGAGTEVEDNVEPVLVNETQNQSTSTKQHSHGAGTLEASIANATAQSGQQTVPVTTNAGSWEFLFLQVGAPNATVQFPVTVTAGGSNSILSHEHDVAGDTSQSTIDNSEVRPSTYGVHYIIKL
jgi:hypothetical protein